MQLTPETATRNNQSEREPLKPDELKEWMSEQEGRDAGTLVEITGAAFDRAVGVLRKHNGDMQKAADSLLRAADGPDPAEQQREADLKGIKEHFGHLFTDNKAASDGAGPARSNIIDLTGDDDPPTDTRFRATTRSPDPAWQLVRTQASKTADEELHEAIQASYKEFADESDDVPPDEMGLREGNRPIVLRSDAPATAYAALVVQSLFHIPQVRQRCSQLRLHLVDGNKPKTYPDWAIWTLIEMFTALDLAEIAVFLDSDMIQAWDTEPLTQGVPVGVMSKRFLEKVINVVQDDLDMQQIERGTVSRLFYFTYCKIHSPVAGAPETVFESNTGHIVPIEISPDAPPNGNALVTRLSQTFNTYHDDGSSDHQLIIQPSEMVTFEISVNAPATAPAEREPLTYPKTIYMDEFLAVNLDLANETRAAQRQMQKEIDALVARKQSISRFEDQDTFEHLRGAIDYYENIAQCDSPVRQNSPERITTLQLMATKLKNTLAKLEDEVKVIDEKISSFQTELDEVSNNPELRCHPYDLRAVLVHTGLPGRKHIYSFVQDKGVWWRTVDYTVTEVSEDVVLSDPTGLHLGAGPYMLMYSRRQSEAEMSAPVNWPPLFASGVETNNMRFHEAERAKALALAGLEESRGLDGSGDAMDLS
ncbi:hypothetical protein GGX14DRAFT_450460 [Mycena pura]|uniref:USP domain-containing protein n=1 Tax=Mycena pura TaxID=153505 RepID=A0AAD6YB10_9AGAR|nr:hypothetical protein GGX14DRAFT_450460 [Mycena pura]